MNTNNMMCESAQAYRAWGWSVLPVAAKSKELHSLFDKLPYGPFEFAKRLATEDEIDAWFAEDPNANIAVMCGPISHLLILDVDDQDEHPELAAMLAGLDVPIVKTARGYHYYFAYPEGEALSQVNKPFAWMDVRGVNDYALLPPSAHPSGAEYEWLVSPALRQELLTVPDGEMYSYQASAIIRADLPQVPPALLELLKSSVDKFEDGSWFDDGYPDEDDEDDDWDDDDEDDDWDDDDDDYLDEEASEAEGEELAVSLLQEQGSGQTVAVYLHACMVEAEKELCYVSTDIDDWKLLGLVRKALAISKLWQAKPEASVDELKAATLDVPAEPEAIPEKKSRF